MDQPSLAKDIMRTNLITLSPEMDAYDAIDLLLANRISGAPVVDADGTYLGVFSEKCCMKILIEGAYEDLPSPTVGAFMRPEAMTITEDTDLLTIANIFLNTPYRRLPVLRDGMLVGQVSRREVLHTMSRIVSASPEPGAMFLYLSQVSTRAEVHIG